MNYKISIIFQVNARTICHWCTFTFSTLLWLLPTVSYILNWNFTLL